MENTDNNQERLLTLDWMDFSRYPKNGLRVMIHAVGFDIIERVQKHFFFEIKSFDIMNFPTAKMQKELKKSYSKWHYSWFPAKIKKSCI